MNRAYRVVWSKARQSFVVAAETARAWGKRSGRGMIVVSGLFAASLTVSAANLPVSGSIVAGAGSIEQSGTTMTITQSSDRMVADWQSFSIGQGYEVRFVQPSSRSVTLNRVLGPNVSVVQGRLVANGQVFLINPNGMLFTPSAQVEVGGLVAATRELTNEDFMAGRYRFAGSSNSAIYNAGTVKAVSGGTIAFIAAQIENTGLIEAPRGNVLLAAGNRVRLDLGDPVKLEVEEGALNALIEQGGAVRSDGGRVLLTAKAVGDLASAVVNHSGVIEANTLKTGEHGEILLLADKNDGRVVVNGKLDASGLDTASGGYIGIEGGFVALGGELAADGAQGGRISVDAYGTISLADTVHAKGLSGAGGHIAYHAGERFLETTTSRNDVSGATEGGYIRVQSGGDLLSSGAYHAEGGTGAAGRIDLSGVTVRLMTASLNAAGVTQGGLVRVGGAFQGGKTPNITNDANGSLHYGFVERFGATEAIESAHKTFVNDTTRIDVSASRGTGGTAIVWSKDETTFLGSIDARGGDTENGGFVEISSAQTLRHANLDAISGAREIMLDPKNIIIGSIADVSNWSHIATLGKGYVGGQNVNVSGLDNNDSFGFSVALNANGDRLAVGVPSDDGQVAGSTTNNYGAVYLFSFTDNNFSGGSLDAIIGKGYTGGKNVNIALDKDDRFGTALSFNAVGDRLAVSASGDDGQGAGSTLNNYGAVYLFSFTDGNFSGGNLEAIIGKGYNGDKNLDLSMLDIGDNFGRTLALNATGDRMAVGASLDDGADNSTLDVGAVYLFSFSDGNFNSGQLKGVIGKGYTGPSDIDMSSHLAADDRFGHGVSLNAAGNLLAVGAIYDDGADGTTLDAGAVYLFSFTDGNFNGGQLQGILGKGYTGAKSFNLSGLDSGDGFGVSSTFSAAGDRLAVGALWDDGDGVGSNSNNYGAVYLFSFDDGHYGNATLRNIIGKGYSGPTNINMVGLDTGDLFGFSVSHNASGNRLAVGAYNDDGAANSATNSGSVHLFSATPSNDPDPISDANTFATRPSDDVNLSRAQLEHALKTGVNVTLQASNDITLQAGAPSPNGATGLDWSLGRTDVTSGNLTLRAGRSVVLNGTIRTGGGNLSVIANENVAAGVVDAHRDAGAASITAAAIDASGPSGYGDVMLRIQPGTGKTHSASGNIHLNGNITAGALVVDNQGPTAGAQLVLDSGVTLTAHDSGDALVLNAGASGVFVNGAGTSALSAPNGRWLVYSQNPANDTRGGLAYAFKQYNATYPDTVVLGIGNGFLYSAAPTLTAALTGTVSKVYDGNATATLAPANYTVSGAIDGDTVTLNNPTSGAYDNKNVGANKPVTVNGLTASATNGSAPVYGYQLASTTVSANIGEITARPLTLAGLKADDKVYDGTTVATLSSTGTLSGVIGSDDVSVSGTASASFADKNVGTSKPVTVSGLTLTGADAGNYTLGSGAITTTASITPRPITIRADNKIKFINQPDPVLTYSTSCGVQTNDCGPVPGEVLFGSLERVSGEDVGQYAILQGTVTNTNNPNYEISFLGAHLTITEPIPIGQILSIVGNQPSTSLVSFGQAFPITGAIASEGESETISETDRETHSGTYLGLIEIVDRGVRIPKDVIIAEEKW